MNVTAVPKRKQTLAGKNGAGKATFFSEHVDAIEQELKELKKQLRNLEN
jgi:ABC-type Mn2+/Zn2+ transport system ATPase subunit